MKIVLRKMEAFDLPYLYQWENDSAVWSEGSTHNPLSQSDLRDYIASTTGDIFRDGQLRLIIQLDDDQIVDGRIVNGETVGCVDLFDLDARNRKVAVGLYVTPDMRGRGVGEEALRKLEKMAFCDLGLRMLYAVVGVHNTPCLRLYEKMNYVPTAQLIDWTLEGDAQIWQKRNTSL